MFTDRIFQIAEETGAQIIKCLNESDDQQKAESTSAITRMEQNGR